MAKLSTLTDYYEPETLDSLPVDNPYVPVADPTRRVPVYASEPETKLEEDAVDTNTMPSKTSVVVDKILNKLFRDDDKRYQLWPEKVVREALSAGHDVMKEGTNLGLRREDVTDIPPPDMPTKDSTWLGEKLGIAPVAASPQDKIIEQGQAMSALAGSGGLGGVTDATLGATPFLRPALKYKDKLYKGKEGQQHMDVIPEALYPEFQKMAMSGEDISHYNFGFVNDRGHFLDREKALKYAIDTGMVDKFAGQYGALTSTLLADSTKPGMAIEAMAKANPFFSAVEHNVAKIPQAKMTGDQWLGTLANKPGVKPEELDWTGLKSFLEENKGKPVTKAQIEEHLAANKVELKEVSKGTGELNKAAKEFNAEAGPKPISLPGRKGQLYADEIEQGLWDGSLTPKDLPTNLQPYAEKMLSLRYQQGNPTKYHSYQLPGGENYREMLLTLPESNPIIKLNAEYKALSEEYLKSKGQGLSPEKQARWAQVEDEITKLRQQGVTEDSGRYRSSHWDEPNILAHVRMNDRDVGGKKSLHLEEIQSDWHQQGRDRGYAQDIPQVMAYYEVKGQKIPIGGGKTKDEALASTGDWPKTLKDAGLGEVKFETTYRKGEGVPDAPFKKTWHELALKRMIREAAEKGYDRLSWTPGEAQAARYDLSKSVDTISALGPDKNGKYLTYIEGKDKQPLFRNRNGFSEHGQKTMTAEELEATVGKDVAKKLMEGAAKNKNNEKTNGFFDLKGDNLKIGGEGMKGFYDQIIPKALEKLGKEHGVKVKTHEPKKVEASPEAIEKLAKTLYETYDRKGGEPSWEKLHSNKQKFYRDSAKEKSYLVDNPEHKVHYIDLPQSLKDQAIGKGFPLFSNRYMFTPVDYEPEFK